LGDGTNLLKQELIVVVHLLKVPHEEPLVLKVALDSKATSHLRNQLIAPLDLSTESCAGLLQRS
jgi:hypothetical protein